MKDMSWKYQSPYSPTMTHGRYMGRRRGREAGLMMPRTVILGFTLISAEDNATFRSDGPSLGLLVRQTQMPRRMIPVRWAHLASHGKRQSFFLGVIRPLCPLASVGSDILCIMYLYKHSEARDLDTNPNSSVLKTFW
jgi:hypothetical protein